MIQVGTISKLMIYHVIGLITLTILSSMNTAAFKVNLQSSRRCNVVEHRTKSSRTPFVTHFAKPIPFETNRDKNTELFSAGGDDEKKLPMLLDIGTKGGAVFLSLLLFIVPIIGYIVVTEVFGVDDVDAGRYIGVGFTVFACIGWASTYVMRVATKDMTYAKQLKEYENAVIAKRLEELDEDEVQALVEDIERDNF
mmetsp:Transcript_10053/g.11532  ORF Transcript_10053/g.11532 Transcript_10053/m.11532 type:complete len:196 (-) Transcript_10053:259-846(-)